LLVVAFLCAVVCAQTAALAFEHQHLQSSEHCCGLCHLGPLPFLQAAPVVQIAPVVAVGWFGGSSDSGQAPDTLIASTSCRAPPAAFSA
jgi:hypothetical protein